MDSTDGFNQIKGERGAVAAEKDLRQPEVSAAILRARRATQRSDWLEAWRCWEVVRARSPHHAPAYVGAGNALREAGRFDEAELLLGGAAQRFPDDEQIAIARAWLANARCDWTTALSRWEVVRARSPHHAPAYVGTGNALREAGRFDEAELLLGGAAQRFPDDEQIAIARAWLANARCDWTTALSRWEVVRARSPHHAPAYVGTGNALREAGRFDEAELLLGGAAQRFPDDEQIAIARAWLANARCDWTTALSRWEVVRARSPHHAPAYVGTGNALREAGRFDEAELLLGGAAQRFPDDEQIAIARAWLANARCDWTTALSRWEVVRARSPHHAPAYVGTGNALREAGRFDEAELLLGGAAQRFPDDEQIAIARAWLANARCDWTTALSRWESLRALSSNDPWCYLGNIWALRGAGRFDQAAARLATADAVLTAARARGLAVQSALRLEFEIARARL